jgi:hypothetical protein
MVILRMSNFTKVWSASGTWLIYGNWPAAIRI